MQPVCNATRYEARVRLNHAQWLPSRFFDSARAMVLDGLPQRTLCIVQVRAIPDSKEPTDWSAPVSRMTL